MRRAFRGLVVCGGVLSLGGVARAHEVGRSRFGAPLPLSLLFAGAGATVALTAVWLVLSNRNPSDGTTQRTLLTLSPTAGTGLRLLGRVGFFLLVGAAIVDGIVGRRVPAENLATVFVWPVWLKGVGLVAILVGSPWRTLSPWETLYDLLVWAEGTKLAVTTYPGWLTSWPAVAGFVLGIGVVENLTVIVRSPRVTVLVVVGYTLVMVLGAVAFGRTWFERADALTVLYELFGRIAPVQFDRTADGGYDVQVRPPWRESTRALPDGSLVVFVVATVYTVSFDGFTNTPEYRTALFSLRDGIGIGPVASLLVYLVGLLVFVVSFYGAAVAVQRIATGTAVGWRGSARAFGGTVLPIAAAYELAHNYPFVLQNVGQWLSILRDVLVPSGDPLSLLGWLSVPVFWGSQVLLVVGGHIVAVVAAHSVAVDRYPTRRLAQRGHAPLVVVMVGYTVLSLWIVSRPVVS